MFMVRYYATQSTRGTLSKLMAINYPTSKKETLWWFSSQMNNLHFEWSLTGVSTVQRNGGSSPSDNGGGGGGGGG